MNKVAEIGHNLPPDPIDEATAPYADAIDEAQNWLDGGEVTNAGQMATVDALLKDVKAAEKAVKDAEASESKPLHDAWKAAKARYKPTIDDLGRIKTGLIAIVSAFKKRESDRIAAEKRAAWEAAEKARKEAEDAAMTASASNIDEIRAAAEKQRAAEIAQAEASAASRQKLKGMRTVHRHEITDMRAAVNWIAKNDKAAMADFVTEYVRRNFRDTAIDGVKAWTEKEAF